MRIRDLQWKGIPAWPPEWWTTDQGGGEDGFLETVNIRKDPRLSCISMVVNHFGSERRGIMILDDPAHLYILYRKLKENIGKQLGEIGDLEIDFGPSIPKKGFKQVRPQTTPDIAKRKSQINGA
jgi:hypothetical protein